MVMYLNLFLFNYNQQFAKCFIDISSINVRRTFSDINIMATKSDTYHASFTYLLNT